MNPIGRTLRTLSKGYVHEPAVVRQFNELISASRSHYWSRVSLKDAHSTDYLRLETMVCMIRDHIVHNEIQEAWKVLELLTDRVNHYISKCIRRWIFLSAAEIEEVSETVISKFYEFCLSLEPRAEFWEVRFLLCLERLVVTEARNIQQANSKISELPTGATEDEYILDPLEQFVDNKGISPELSAQIRLALLSLPECNAQVFYLYHYEGWKQSEIADRLNLSVRTIGNYMRRAEQQLLQWRLENKN